MSQADFLKAYVNTNAEGAIMDANPHRIIQLLLEGALEKIAAAKGYMHHNNVAEKGRNISVAISIIETLRLSLDKEVGGDFAANLEFLYDHMMLQLFKANKTNEEALLDHVTSLLNEIKSGWDVIPDILAAEEKTKIREGEAA